ncbi:hypothetical protein [Neisseria flavescens]|uniref:hypothetical protein n=1 Tax=Neisseria flavescens TaxID=484 RepID=UPI003D80916E
MDSETIRTQGISRTSGINARLGRRSNAASPVAEHLEEKASPCHGCGRACLSAYSILRQPLRFLRLLP